MAKGMEKLRKSGNSTAGTEEGDLLKKNNQNHKPDHVQTPAISECSVSLLGTNDGDCKLEIKSAKYFVYSIRFWQYFAIMVLGNYFGTFFSYSYKPFGENTEPHD